MLALPLLCAGLAHAADPPSPVECATLSPAPIYGSGGSAQKPLVGKIATQLITAAHPITIVYASPGACVGVNAVFGPTAITGTASYWNAAGTS